MRAEPIMPDTLKPYRLYLGMFVLNLAVVIGVIYLLNREPARPLVVTVPPTRIPVTKQADARIIVTVTGAVKNPGAIQLSGGALLAHALQEAGLQNDADVSKLDLARTLQDGDKIFVPASAQAAVQENPKPTATDAARNVNVDVPQTPGAKLNLNAATLEQLDALPGIGPALAQRILDYRAEHGGFKTIEELQDVKGIGETLYHDIKELVTLQ